MDLSIRCLMQSSWKHPFICAYVRHTAVFPPSFTLLLPPACDKACVRDLLVSCQGRRGQDDRNSAGDAEKGVIPPSAVCASSHPDHSNQ